MVDLELHRHTLTNGLRVVLAPDRIAPVVGVSVHYDVGFRSEPPGHTGFAHLFEHLMFQGSESLDKLAHFRLVQSSGGSCNGSTRQDWTEYHQVLPAAALERALFCEADRMRAPRITVENLRNQVAVVQEEIRLNVLDRPYGGFPWILLPPVLYRTFANAHNGYGDFTDLEQATLDDCAAFFDTYYPPGNAVLTITGDIEVDRAVELVERHFGDVPAGRPPAQESFAEPPPAEQRYGRHPDPHAPLPALAVGYRLPDPVAALDGYLAHVVLAALLADGDTARLRDRLVHREALAVDVSAQCGLFGAFSARDPDTFVLTATHPTAVPADALLAAVDDELARLAADGPDPDELAGVTARRAAGLSRAYDSLATRTLALGSMELLGDAGLLGELARRIQAVTAAEVAAAAAALRPTARAVLAVEPASASEPAADPADPPAVTEASPTVPALAAAGVHRSAEEIGRTPAGPRPLPDLAGEPPLLDRALAEVAETVLDGGLRVIAVRSPAVPLVELRLRVPFGGTEPDHAAVAELLAATLLTGTGRRSRPELDAELARVGGELYAGRDPEWLRVSGRSLAGGLDTLLDVLADVLTGPAYADTEVQRERDRLVEQTTLSRAEPGVIAREALCHHVYGDHPIGDQVPRPGEVAAVIAEQVRALHGRVLPRGSVLVLVGDLDCDAAVRTAGAALAGWHSVQPAIPLPPLPPVQGGDLLLVHRPEAVQAQIRLCAQAVPRSHPDYPTLRLANLVFGGYFSSRLVENIREDKGYTYSVRSGVESTGGAAALVVAVETSTQVTAPALAETRRELGRLAESPPTAAEVSSARRYAVGSLLTGTASQAALASVLAELASDGLDPEWLRRFPERLNAVTDAEVARAGRDLLTPAAFTGVVVGDAESLAEPLRPLGVRRAQG